MILISKVEVGIRSFNEINEYSKITKADIVKFANDFFKDNYVVVYKEKGVNDKVGQSGESGNYTDSAK